MKQTAITISINKSNNNMIDNSEQRMTSMEIAELTGKQHKDVLKAIRNMEPGWEKVAGRKFALGSYKDANGQLRPCYNLSKTECLFVSTKFNDEARARLVIRWQQLEEERLEAMAWEQWKARWGRRTQGTGPQCGAQLGQSPFALLGCTDEEVLDEADDIIGEELDELNRYSDDCYTPTEIGKPFGLEGRDLNSFLCDKKIIEWAKGQWQLTPKFKHQGLTENRSIVMHGRNGRRRTVSRLVWTAKGRDFVLSMIKG